MVLSSTWLQDRLKPKHLYFLGRSPTHINYMWIFEVAFWFYFLHSTATGVLKFETLQNT